MRKIYTPDFFKRDMYLSILDIDGDDYDDDGNPITGFDEPIPFLKKDGVNYQPLESEGDIRMYGSSSSDIIKAVIMNTDKAYEYFNQDMVGSVVYLFGASPNIKPLWDKSTKTQTEHKHGFWANYKVDAVMPMLVHTNVFFKKHKRTGV